MTTPSTPRKAGPYTGNGTTTSWPFSFKVFAASDIAVTVADTVGTESTLVLDSDYTVTLNADQETSPGGAISYALPSAYTLTVTGGLDYDQTYDIPSGGNFSPAALENALDRITMQVQQLREIASRSLKVSVTTENEVTLPSPASTTIIGWDTDGQTLTNYPLEELATAASFASYRYDTFEGDGVTTAFLLTSDPVVLGNIDVSVDGQTYVPGVDHSLVNQYLTFTVAPADGAEILARYGQALPPGDTADADEITFQPVGVGAVTTDVGTKLREFVSVKDFGAKGDGVTDDGPAFQLAVTAAAGRRVYAPSGVYRIATAFGYSTSGYSAGLTILGDGVFKTVFDNQVANGAMLTLDGTGTPSQYAVSAHLEGFSVTTTTSPAASRGIDLKGQWFASVRRVRVGSLTSDGIRIVNNNSDADATGTLELDKVWVQSCGGWGLNIADPTTSSNAVSQLGIKQSYFGGNAAGGARVLGGQVGIEKSAFAYNGGVGLLLAYSSLAGANSLITVTGNEFDDNTGFDVDVLSCLSASIERNKFVYRTSRTGIRIGDGGAGAVQGVKCLGNVHRRDAGTVTLHAVGSNAIGTDVFDSIIPSLTGVTAITDAGSFTRYRSGGLSTKDAIGTVSTTGGGSYTPNVLTATYHRVVVNATGAFTVNAPTGGVANGQEIEIDIYNASGGSMTVTFASSAGGFITGGYTDPADGKRKTARFRYHATDGKWVQIGAWTPDM